MTTEANQQGQGQRILILGMGNPLLDKQIQPGNTELHEKYSLEANGAYLILPDNEKCLLPLFDDLEKLAHMIEHVPGGSAQNTMRVFQWMIAAFGDAKEKGSAAYFGAVGNDQNAAVLKKLATEAGLHVNYQHVEGAKTGTCGVLVHGTERCLIAYLGAAEQFTTSHLAKPENQQLIERAQNYYIEGYFLTVCPEGILQIANHAAKSNKPFCMNLSAEYICCAFLDRLNSLLPFVDLLFGNEQEARAYAKSNEFEEKEDLAKIAMKMAEIEKVNSNRKRTVVITCGSEPILVAQNGQLHQFPVEQIERHQIMDTNGAGDAFCGGFLAAMAQGRPLDKCVAAGNFAARTIIQNSGCTFPANCQYNESK